MIKISINQNECLGCSFCNNCAPEVFEVDQTDYKCKVKKGGELKPEAEVDLTPEQQKQVEEAAINCPVQAIKIE